MWAALRAKVKGWKTILVNTTIGAPALILALLDELKAVDITPLLPPSHALKIIAAMALLGIVLRLATTGPIGSKQS